MGRHVFASIDSLGEGTPIDPTLFDMVILDEAHHSGADTWSALLSALHPRELVGLTGTPERADGIDYEHHFPRPWIGNLRVWNAIPHALVPFRYYMLDVEGADLRDVSWSRAGRYVTDELSTKLVHAADVFVRRAARALAEHVARPKELRALAFCVDRRHAETIAERFARDGYTTRVLTEDTQRNERRAARHDLDSGRVQILCVVDLYNEGVDVPNVNTLFFFRPTESATVFLQQLGRGLRRTATKAELVVFDLTGRNRLEFRFDRRLRALLGHTPRRAARACRAQRGPPSNWLPYTLRRDRPAGRARPATSRHTERCPRAAVPVAGAGAHEPAARRVPGRDRLGPARSLREGVAPGPSSAARSVWTSARSPRGRRRRSQTSTS